MGMWRRHAIYFAPDPGTPLAAFGAAWLGWDPAAGVQPSALAPLPGLPQDRQALTAAARRYGFHATLKAPFRLAEGRDAAALDAAASAIAATLPCFALRLEVALLGGFAALLPVDPPPALAALERALVVGLDPFRAPLTAQEVARRQPERLDPGAAANLSRWGYPWILERFAFHMTLTGPLPPDQQAPVRAALATALAPLLVAPVPVAAICRFAEDADGRFHMRARYPLAPTVDNAAELSDKAEKTSGRNG